MLLVNGDALLEALLCLYTTEKNTPMNRQLQQKMQNIFLLSKNLLQSTIINTASLFVRSSQWCSTDVNCSQPLCPYH